MPRLSVILIVRNEAHTLAACLESVRPIAGEIVVADTGSTDGTPGIARGYGARVGHFAWIDDFAAARNHSIALATGDWLLHMDADEELDPAAADRIRSIVDADGHGHDAVEVTLANYCDDVRAWRWTPAPPGSPYARGRAGYIAVGLLRLFRNGRGFEYREPVHENITASVLEAGGRILHAPDIVIHHHGYQTDPARAAQKAERYLAIARRKRAAAPEDPKALHDFAEQALACGLADEAEQACRHALAVAPGNIESGTTLANILLNRGAHGEARGLLEGLEAAGHRARHLGTALAAIDYRDGRIAKAQARLEAVLDAAPAHAMARLYLARVHDAAGDTARAARELELLHDLVPGVAEFRDAAQAHALRRQGERLFQTGHAAQALESLVESLRLDPEAPMTHNSLGVVVHALGDAPRARQSFARALALCAGLADAHENLARIDADQPAQGSAAS